MERNRITYCDTESDQTGCFDFIASVEFGVLKSMVEIAHSIDLHGRSYFWRSILRSRVRQVRIVLNENRVRYAQTELPVHI